MTMIHGVVGAARFIRSTTLALAASLTVGFVAVQAFLGQYGDPGATMVIDASTDDTVLSAAIAVQESDGLRCSEEPVLTDVVLFQRPGGAGVTVLTFAQAIDAAGDGEGWIRRYCARGHRLP